MSLTKEQRAALPDDAFAAPARRALPIHDAHHVRSAWGQVVRASSLSDDEKVQARHRIVEAAEKLGVDLSGTVASMRLDTPLSAMALAIPAHDSHPNRLPFSGVLTRLDEASDKAPHGSKGRKVVMRAEAAEKALGSLLGMGVNYMASQDGHDVKAKVGVITAADIRDNAVHVDGFIYASDFPEEAARIQSDKDSLGFSWELANIFVASLDADPLVITDCVFTGAAILRKDKAAYAKTSLTASAEEIDDMTKEELAAALAETMKPVTDRLEKIEASQAKVDEAMQASAQTMTKVEPHAKRLDDAADKMETDGIGSDANSGHIHVLRKMASSMRADGAQGRLPGSFHTGMYAAGDDKGGAQKPPPAKVEDSPEFKALKDELAATKTTVADMKAAAATASPQPERKTAAVSAGDLRLLAKAGVSLPEGDAKVDGGALDTALVAAGVDRKQRLTLKASLAQAGLLDR